MKKILLIMLIIICISQNSIEGQASRIWFLSWSNDQSLLAIVRVDGAIEFFDTVSRDIISVTTNLYNSIGTITWSPDNQYIAGNYTDDIVRIWDVSTGFLLHEFDVFGGILGMIWSSDNKLYVSTIELGTYIWDMNTYEFEGLLQYSADTFSFSPNGQYLAIGGRGGFGIYDILSQSYTDIQQYPEIAHSLMWNNDGTKLAGIDLLGNFSVWNFTTNQFEISLQMAPGVLMWWEDNHLYVANDDIINIWDTITWQIISSVPLGVDFFVARNSTGDLYAEFSGTEFEISTYCEIIPSGDSMALSNAILDGNSIQFHKQICLTENATYTLTATLPSITGNITLIGNGATINMTGEAQIFNVAETGALTLKNVTISGGNATQGGAIYNAGELTLEDAVLENNSAVRGGAIYNAGVLTMKGGAIQNNSASEFGGGIYNAGQMSLDGVNIRENDAPEGSGVYQGG